MDGKLGKVVRMKVIEGGVGDSDEDISDARALFDNDVMEAFRHIASSINRDGRVTYIEIGAGQADSDGEELFRGIYTLIRSEADSLINTWHGVDGFCPNDIDGDIFVWIERGYETPWKIAVSDKRNLPAMMSPVGSIFVLNLKKYLPENEFFGMRYPDVVAVLEERHGRESQEVKDVNRIVLLTRMLLFTVVMPIEKRKQLFRELTELCVKLGPAAKAVITDFVDMYFSEYDDKYDEDEEFIGDDPEFCIGMSGCPFRNLI